MSIGQAMSRIGVYSSQLTNATNEHANLQDQMLAATIDGKDPPPGLRARMAKLSILMGLFKEFIDFWKQVIQTFLALVKSINELAQGAR